MAREDHQPQAGPVKRRKRSVRELAAACGDMVAFIRAWDEGTTPLLVQFEDPDRAPVVCAPPEGGKPVPRPLQVYEGEPCVAHAVLAALAAHVARVLVLTSPALEQRIEEALGRMELDVEVIAIDRDAERAATEAACGFEVYGMPYGFLASARERALGAWPAYSGIVVLDADQVRIGPSHIYDVCRDLRTRKADIVTSWITWFPHAPYAVSRAFLENLKDSPLRRPRAEGCPDRPAPRLNVFDHVFGEEKLAANVALPPAAEAFLAACTLPALQAVALAREERAHPDEPLMIPGKPVSRVLPALPSAPNGADRLLLDAAADALAAVEGIAPDEAAELAWADAFGKRCRLDFPLLRDPDHAGKLAFLDNAATTQRAGAALAAMRRFDEHSNANVYRGAYALSAQATFMFNDARARIEGFIGAKRRSTVFTMNTTAACNLVAQAWGTHHVHEGDLIAVGLSEHHSNLVPFLMLAQRTGARIAYIPYGPDGRYDRRAYADILAQRPKLVCLAHVGNMFGIEEPVAALAADAHDAGAHVLVDAAQSFPHMAIDVSALGADWVAFSGHKAYGPLGIGCLWIADGAFAEMDPVAGGGGTVSHVGTDSYYLRMQAIQYELGTPPISQAIGLAAAVDALDTLGMGAVRRHEAALTRHLLRGLRGIPGVTVLGDHSGEDGQVGLVSFVMPGCNTTAMATFLGNLGVCIRAGGHCALPLHAALGLSGTARISLGVYTTRDDIDAAVAAIRVFARLYG